MRISFAVVALLGVALPAQDKARNAPLHIAYVGDLESDRGRDFVQFLREQFPRVDAVERTDCAPNELRAADVVVLDWPQQEGVLQWMRNRDVAPTNPLGGLARWDRPTVLIGSAGLNAAAVWGLPGNWG